MDAIARRLLFRIGPIGFYLGLNQLIEIREQISEQIDFSQIDDHLSVVGALPFRQTLIPVVDVSRRLAIETSDQDTVLVLSSRDGNWGLLVDRIEGFYASAEMADLPLPQMLMADGWRCFDRVALYAGIPYLRLEPTECYPGWGA